MRSMGTKGGTIGNIYGTMRTKTGTKRTMGGTIEQEVEHWRTMDRSMRTMDNHEKNGQNNGEH